MAQLVQRPRLLVEIVADAAQVVDQILVGEAAAGRGHLDLERGVADQAADGGPEELRLVLHPLVVVRLEADSDEAAELDGHGIDAFVLWALGARQRGKAWPSERASAEKASAHVLHGHGSLLRAPDRSMGNATEGRKRIRPKN